MVRLSAMVLATLLASGSAQACYLQSDAPGKPLCGGGYSEGREAKEMRAEQRRLIQTQQEILDYNRGMVPMVGGTNRHGRWVDQNGWDGVPDGYVGDEP